MSHQQHFSRRQFLKSAAAASCVTATGGVANAWAQGAQRIERLDPALDRILSSTQPIQELGSGYGGAMGPAEGRCGGKKAATCCSATSTMIDA